MEYNRNTPHQGGTKAFKELTYKEQALSISGTIANLEKAVRYHAKFGSGQIGRKEARNPDEAGETGREVSCTPSTRHQKVAV